MRLYFLDIYYTIIYLKKNNLVTRIIILNTNINNIFSYFTFLGSHICYIIYIVHYNICYAYELRSACT